VAYARAVQPNCQSKRSYYRKEIMRIEIRSRSDAPRKYCGRRKAKKTRASLVITVTGCIVAFAFSLICGCSTPQQQYWRSHISNPYPPFTNPAMIGNTDFSIIEFDDQGELWDRRQLSQTLERIRQVKQDEIPVTLLVFVHGWNNDASASSGNLRNFYNFVSNLSKANLPGLSNQQMTNGIGPRRLFAVYLAWRGNIAQWSEPVSQWTAWPSRIASFYSRKSTASRVGGVACTETILSLAARARINESTNVIDPSRVVIIGHSFGGLIVERALSQAMLGGMLVSAPFEQEWRTAKADALARASDAVTNRLWNAQILKEHEWVRAPGALRTFEETNLFAITEVLSKLRAEHATNQTSTILAKSSLEETSGPARETADQAASIWETLTSRRGLLAALTEAVAGKKKKDSMPSFRLKFPALEPTETTNYQAFIIGASNSIAGHITGLIDGHTITNKATNILAELRHELSAFGALAADAILGNHGQRHEQWLVALQRENEIAGRIAATNRLLTLERTNVRARFASTNTWYEMTKRAIDDAVRIERHYRAEAERKANVDRPPADMVLLVNPATEALTAKNMIEALEENSLIRLKAGTTNSARPWIISVSSPGDQDTGFWFPVGRYLSGIFKSFRSYGTHNDYGWEQFRHYTQTAPHSSSLLSHEIVPLRSPGDPQPVSTLEDAIKVNLNSALWTNNPHGFVTSKSNYVVNVVSTGNRSGYWVVRSTSDVIRNHSQVFETDFYAMAAAFLRMSQAFTPRPTPKAGSANNVAAK
jgi:hypothetical protein